MQWQTFRDQKEVRLAQCRDAVTETLSWRIPDFTWSAQNLKSWYDQRHQWEDWISDALEILYRYDYPLRRVEDLLVRDENWLTGDFDRLHAELARYEEQFWQRAARTEQEPSTVQTADSSPLWEWWRTVASREGPHTLTVIARRPIAAFVARVIEMAQTNDYDAQNRVEEDGSAEIWLTPRRFVPELQAAAGVASVKNAPGPRKRPAHGHPPRSHRPIALVSPIADRSDTEGVDLGRCDRKHSAGKPPMGGRRTARCMKRA